MNHLLILASLALASCATVPQIPASGVIARADTVILTGERAFAVAELGYITAAKGVGIAVDAGLITGTTAKWVRERNAEARELLIKGKATADAAEKARIATRLFGITDSLNATNGSK